ncbi:hypothetical protein WA158_007558 [Blastocystis sp. Blastoise]
MNKNIICVLAILCFANVFASEYVDSNIFDSYSKLLKNPSNFKTLPSLYNAIKLSNDLQVRINAPKCSDIKFDVSTSKNAFYSTYIAKQLKCDDLQINSKYPAFTLEEQYFASLLNQLSDNSDNVATKTIEVIKPCMNKSGCSLSLNDVSYAFKILEQYYSSCSTIIQENIINLIPHFAEIANLKSSSNDVSLVALSRLADSAYQFGIKKHDTFFNSFAIDFLYANTIKSIYTNNINIASYVTHIMSILSSENNDGLFYSIEEDANVISIRPVNYMGRITSDNMEIQLDEQEKTDYAHRKGMYFVPKMDVAPGSHILHIKHPKKTTNYIFIVQNVISIKNYSISAEGSESISSLSLPYITPSILPTIEDAVTMNIEINLINQEEHSYIPTYNVIDIQKEGSKKYTQIVLKNDNNVLKGTFNIMSDEFSHNLNFESGTYSFILHSGDEYTTPISIKIYDCIFTYPDIDRTIHYPLYTKPLTYESDTTLEPLPEIHHTFNIDTKQPSILISYGYSIAVILLFTLCVLIVLSKFTKSIQIPSFFKLIAILIFIGCLVLIGCLYFKFWYDWTMFDLLRTLIPLLLITVVVGNQALKN